MLTVPPIVIDDPERPFNSALFSLQINTTVDAAGNLTPGVIVSFQRARKTSVAGQPDKWEVYGPVVAKRYYGIPALLADLGTPELQGMVMNLWTDMETICQAVRDKHALLNS